MAARLSGPAFIGRERELTDLRHALSCPPAIVLVEGEAGIGKTRLVQEALDPIRALVAACPPLREPFTLGPVIDALRHAAGDIGALRLTALAGALLPFLPEWADELPAALEPLDDGPGARHRLFRALAELIEALEIELLVVEDVHWADDTTVEFLLFLQSSRPPALSLLVSYRPEDVPAGSLVRRLGSPLPAGTGRLRITLGSLDVDQTAGLVSSMLQGEQVSTEFAAFLHHRTEGVPLAVEEVVRLMHDRADLTRRSGEWVRRHLDAIVVPPTVRDAVLERVTRLGPDAQAVLRAAAVLTAPADDAALAVVSELPADRAAAGIDEAVAAGLLRELERRLLGFRHVLASWAVYESVPGSVRRALHRRAGEHLEQVAPPPLARLARHFREAGDTVRWCRYAEAAADVALASGAAAEAVTLLYDLIVVSRPPAGDLVRLMNKVPHATPQRYRELVVALRAALDDDLDPSARAEVRFQLGHLLTKMQEYGAGRAELELAIPDLGHDPYRAVRAMVLLGWPLDGSQPASVHLGWMRRAADGLPQAGSPERTRLDLERAGALLLLGDAAGWEVAADLPDDGDTHQLRRFIASGHINLSHLATVWGRYAEGRRRVRAAAELARTSELGNLDGIVAVNGAHLDLFTGDWDGLADRAEALAANEDLLPMTRIEAQLVREQLRQMVEPPSARDDRLVAVLEGSLRHGAVAETMEPAAALARHRLATGRVTDALAVTDRPMQIVERTQIWVWTTELVPVQVRALIAADRPAEAVSLVEAFGAGLGELDAPAPRAALMLCRAIVADAAGDVDSAAAFERAAVGWDLLPRPYDALLAREQQGHCLLRAGRIESAVELLGTVFGGLSELGARPAAARVAETLRQHGADVRSPWRGGRRGYGDELSPRELDVVRLLVGGRTNREIAQALFLSPKTVARHLNSAMRKLGVTSRTAVAVQAIETGVVPAP
jgi:DNA-binding CsgD family transcriptional regulator